MYLFLIGYTLLVILNKPHNLVHKGFPACFAEMDMYVKGGIPYPLHKVGLRVQRGGGADAALNDRKGRGRRREISDSDITWVIDKACEKPVDHGYSAELWYPASFTRFIHSVVEQEGHPRMADVAESTLRTILKNARLRPFKVTYYCEKRDPDFKEKMHDVLVIYKQVSMQFDVEGDLRPFEGVPVHTLSYDEKPGIQAVGTTGKDKPPVPDTEKTARSSETTSMSALARFPSLRA